MKKLVLLSISLFLLSVFPAGILSYATTETPSVLDEAIKEQHGVRIPVLMYHHISNDVTSESVVTPEKFRHNMSI